MLELLTVIFFLCNRAMALDLCQNFIFAQYLENKWTEFDKKNLYSFILTISRLGMFPVIFSQICYRTMALDWGQNFVST